MSTDDLIARDLRQAWSAARPECPSPASLLPSELAALPAFSRRAIDAHLRTCPACAAEAELAAAFEFETSTASSDVDWVVERLEAGRAGGVTDAIAAAIPIAPAATTAPAPTRSPVVRLPPPRRARFLLPLAAAVMIAVGSALVVREVGFDRAPALPDRVAGDVERGGFIDALEPQGELGAAPARFAWTAVERAAVYVVTVRAVDDTVLWSARVDAATSSPVTPELSERLLARVRYRWQVEALDAAGASLAVSEPTNFVVRPPPGPGVSP